MSTDEWGITDADRERMAEWADQGTATQEGEWGQDGSVKANEPTTEYHKQRYYDEVDNG